MTKAIVYIMLRTILTMDKSKWMHTIAEYIGVMEPLVSEQTEPVKLADKVIAKL